MFGDINGRRSPERVALRSWRAACVFAAMAASLTLPAASLMAGPLGVVDNFIDANLAARYTQSVVLEQSGVNAVSFLVSGGQLQASKGADTGAEQVVLLRDDFTLEVGERLRVDTVANTSVGYADFGIAVSNNVDPIDAMWTAGTADARNGYAAVYLKGQTSNVGYFVAQVGGGQLASSAGALPAEAVYADVTGLYITRTTPESFALGFSNAGGDVQLTSVTFNNDSVGAAVGFYADLRDEHTFGDLDNLRIESAFVPGDVTGEGDVDYDDFVIIRNNLFTSVAARIDGDLNGDNFVDFIDFRLWKDNAGPLGAGVSLFGNAVPEPSTALLTTLAALLVSLFRSRARRPLAGGLG